MKLYLFAHFLFLLSLAFPGQAKADDPRSPDTEQRHRVFVIYEAENDFHKELIHQLSLDLSYSRSGIEVHEIDPVQSIEHLDRDGDLIIGIGAAGIKSADQNYPEINKLFISTDSSRYRLDKVKNKDDAILYMTQPYCRQIHFIKQINHKWKTISILNSREKPVDSTVISKCASGYGIDIYTGQVTEEGNIAHHLKDALNHSDVLLALPDNNIYNGRTVKNILLTSYRHRKPVIAFSKNFVSAGALASIYSDTRQIAHSGSKLVEEYFESGNVFRLQVNHPDDFELDINKQVFKALSIPLPDTDDIKKSLQTNEQRSSVDL